MQYILNEADTSFIAWCLKFVPCKTGKKISATDKSMQYLLLSVHNFYLHLTIKFSHLYAMENNTDTVSSPVIHLDTLDYFNPFEGLKAKLIHTVKGCFE